MEVKGLLRTVEEQKNELAEQLKNANANVEQYRAVVLTLEDSLKKEKEVQHWVIVLHQLIFLFFHIHTTLCASHTHLSHM